MSELSMRLRNMLVWDESARLIEFRAWGAEGLRTKELLLLWDTQVESPESYGRFCRVSLLIFLSIANRSWVADQSSSLSSSYAETQITGLMI